MTGDADINPEDATLRTIEPRIPPRAINYNQSPADDLGDYIKNFKTASCLKELPFLINRVGLKPGSALLDYGCGLGRLAYAASHYLDRSGAYFGYEINQQALSFLKQAYADLPNFRFDGSQLQLQDDYIALAQGQTENSGASSDEVEFTAFLTRKIDVQWTSSVFSHMWQSSIIRTLKKLNASLSRDGVCVNTWLIIDDFASYALKCGVADRTLPFKINGAWTYLQDNPLMCTAYELADVQSMYAQAGHTIEEILWGSWSGRMNPATYLDVVISRPAKRGFFK